MDGSGRATPVAHRAQSQRGLLERFNAAEAVDIHCHCLPCVDDGPNSMTEAVALCRALVDDGITTAVATPHQLGTYSGRNGAAQVRGAVETLQCELRGADIPLNVRPGADVRIDPKLVALLKSDEILTLADGHKYLLIELPHEVLINLQPLVAALVGEGVCPILSHPERHPVLMRQPLHLLAWLERGALLQVTAGSLIGDFGGEAERCAWDWLGSGLVSFVASDAHGIERRPPRMSEAAAAISRQLGHAVARRVCLENPLRVLRGEEIVLSLQRLRLNGRR